jgi:serine/threonine-protein kinase
MTEVDVCRLLGVEGFQKKVVVKRIAPEHADDPRYLDLFLDEARIASRLSHPNIVQLFEVGEADGVPYAAMEYVKGVSLGLVAVRAQHARKVHYGHLAAIMARICDALDYLHGPREHEQEPRRSIHADLSANNIVVSIEGVPKLLAFGMGNALLRLSQPDPSPAADVLGAGATLFEVTTGTSPFGTQRPRDAEGLERLSRLVYPRPSALVPGYPPALERIVLSALERDVRQRCPSARELRERLDELATGPEHRSNPIALAAWMRELFPDFLALTRVNGWTVSSPNQAAWSDEGTGRPRLSSAGSDAETPAVMPILDGQQGAPTPLPTTKPPLKGGGARVMVAKGLALAAAGLAIGGGLMTVIQHYSDGPPPVSSAPQRPSPDIERPAPKRELAAPTGPSDEPAPAPQAQSSPPAEAPPAAEAPPPAESPPSTPSSREPPSARPRPGSRPTPARRQARLSPSPTTSPARQVRERPAAPTPSLALATDEPDPEPAVEASPLREPVDLTPPPETTPPPPVAPAPPPPTVTPAETSQSARPAPSRPASAPTANAGGRAVSVMPKSPIPIPTLPRVLQGEPEQMARACQAVETAAIRLAGVSPEFARGVTGPMRRALRPGTPIYPIGMFYFVVREAGLRHDHQTAAANLAAAQWNGLILRYKNLPGIEGGL